jgi:hypothetical protein
MKETVVLTSTVTDNHNSNTSIVCGLQNRKKRWERCIKVEKSTSKWTEPSSFRKRFIYIVRNLYGQTSYCFVWRKPTRWKVADSILSFKHECFWLCTEGSRLSSLLGHRLTTLIYFAILLRVCGQMSTELADLKMGHEILFPYPSKFVIHSPPLNHTFVSDLFLKSLSLNKLQTLINIVAFRAFLT